MHPFEEVKGILCYRFEPVDEAALFPVSVSAISHFFLLHKIDIPGDDCCPAASPAPDHCYTQVWPMTGRLSSSVTSVQSPDNLGQISPLPSSITTISSLPWPASSLLISGIAFCLSPCYSLLFLSKVKMYFPQCKRLKLKFRIQRRCGMMLWLNCYVIYFIIPRVSCRE